MAYEGWGPLWVKVLGGKPSEFLRLKLYVYWWGETSAILQDYKVINLHGKKKNKIKKSQIFEGKKNLYNLEIEVIFFPSSEYYPATFFFF